MEMILALVVVYSTFLLFYFALGKGVEEGVLRHYQDDEIIIITTYIVEDEDEEEIDDEEDDDKVK